MGIITSIGTGGIHIIDTDGVLTLGKPDRC